MRSKNPKRAALVGFVAGVVVLVVAGAGFACTELRGKITMTGTLGASGSATYEGKGGEDIGNGYCTMPAREEFTTSAPAVALAFNLDVERASSCYANLLPSGVYEVRWIKTNESVELASPGAPSCHGLPADQDPTNPWVTLGEMTVGESGTSSGTFALPATSVGPGNICLQDSLDIFNNNAPPVIFMKWTVV